MKSSLRKIKNDINKNRALKIELLAKLNWSDAAKAMNGEKVAAPVEFGGQEHGSTNPEQLFAAG